MSNIISSPDHPNYKAYARLMSSGTHNGAFYYAKELVENIIPHIHTSRPWDTLGMRAVRSADRAIVFIHHNVHCDRTYRWLDYYYDQVLVCSLPTTYEWARQHHRAIYLPLSIDIQYVQQFATKKTLPYCYAGNAWRFKRRDLARMLPPDCPRSPKNLPREELLRFIAPYRKVYAVGRTALEALALGSEIGVCDSRFPDPSFWQLRDNSEAVEILQRELDMID